MGTEVRYSRSTSFHEAGHAAVAWSLGVPVVALWVNADDAGGGAEIGKTAHLRLTEQIAIWSGGAVAQKVFDCSGHELAAFQDNVAIMELLEEHGISEENEGPALRAQGWDIASARPEANRTKVTRVADRLIEHGRMEAPDFLSLMNG
ncbi:hypothetical protein ACQR1Y_11640 [Bradyrhizobium sp. HKCCYLRH3099]|uniref:hypothetical protein n=1 Tax=unclassified Bradyrhizobium TaxID=2631580 RepID=UPI003EBD72A5